MCVDLAVRYLSGQLTNNMQGQLELKSVGWVRFPGRLGVTRPQRSFWARSHGCHAVEGSLVPGEGIEPPTFGLQNRCTTAVLTRPSARFRRIDNRTPPNSHHFGC